MLYKHNRPQIKKPHTKQQITKNKPTTSIPKSAIFLHFKYFTEMVKFPLKFHLKKYDQ